MKPSDLYYRVLEDSKLHQIGSNTWSGGLAVRHGHRIKAFIDQIGAKSALDYGCGKGVQYTHLFEGKPLEEFWGIPVYKYDPAVPADWRAHRPKYHGIDTLPKVQQTLPDEGEWDLLICTHVMGCIPDEDLRGWVIPDIFHKRIRKGMYFAENVQPPTKKVIKNAEDKAAMARLRTPQEWVELVQAPHLEMEFWFRGHDPDRLGARFERWPFKGHILP